MVAIHLQKANDHTGFCHVAPFGDFCKYGFNSSRNHAPSVIFSTEDAVCFSRASLPVRLKKMAGGKRVRAREIAKQGREDGGGGARNRMSARENMMRDVMRLNMSRVQHCIPIRGP